MQLSQQRGLDKGCHSSRSSGSSRILKVFVRTQQTPRLHRRPSHRAVQEDFGYVHIRRRHAHMQRVLICYSITLPKTQPGRTVQNCIVLISLFFSDLKLSTGVNVCAPPLIQSQVELYVNVVCGVRAARRGDAEALHEGLQALEAPGGGDDGGDTFQEAVPGAGGSHDECE